ncbi:hypothetical protein JCM14469_02260 [Desulfatiferula olefinivorans]
MNDPFNAKKPFKDRPAVNVNRFFTEHGFPFPPGITRAIERDDAGAGKKNYTARRKNMVPVSGKTRMWYQRAMGFLLK